MSISRFSFKTMNVVIILHSTIHSCFFFLVHFSIPCPTQNTNNRSTNNNYHHHQKDTIAISSNSFEVELSPTNNTNNVTNNNNHIHQNHHHHHPKKINIRRDLTPGVIEVRGYRLPKAVEEYALSDDLSPDELHFYEDKLLEQERQDEIEFQRRRYEMAKDWEGSSCLVQKHPGFVGDSLHMANSSTLAELETDTYLQLPPRRSRFWYFGFGHRQMSDIQDVQSQNRIPSPQSLSSSSHGTNSHNHTHRPPSASARIGRLLTNAIHGPSSRKFNIPPAEKYGVDDEDDVHLRRHLKAVSVLEKRPLSASDAELLRCIGLDTFVMIRFLRFCFDVTFYPFVVACIILFPTYATNNFEGDIEMEVGTVKTQTDGYFLLTINRLEPYSNKLWVCFGFTVFYLLYVLWRLWIEWETFLPLRFDFLANGEIDQESNDHDGSSSSSQQAKKSYKSRAVVAPKDDVQLHLEQYRNSCIVEYIPDSHRRDQELYQFFDAVFPGQVKRAEILVNATKLTSLIKKRQSVIEKYERIYAKYSYERRRYLQMTNGAAAHYHHQEEGGCCSKVLCRKEPRKPEAPIIRLGKGLNRKSTQALPHYNGELEKLNREIEREYRRVSKEKKIAMDIDQENDFVHTAINTFKTAVTGENSDLKVRSFFVKFIVRICSCMLDLFSQSLIYLYVAFKKCDTGFVEFTNLTAKQSGKILCSRNCFNTSSLSNLPEETY